MEFIFQVLRKEAYEGNCLIEKNKLKMLIENQFE